MDNRIGVGSDAGESNHIEELAMAKGCFCRLPEPFAVLTEEFRRFDFIGIKECGIFDRMLVVMRHFYQSVPVNRAVRRAESGCNVSVFHRTERKVCSIRRHGLG